MTAKEMFRKLGYIKYTKDGTGDVMYQKENFFCRVYS